jgi:hypothetical protein
MAAHPSHVSALPHVEFMQNERLFDLSRFGIPSHIHVCVTGTGSVILDVKRDKYLGLGREATELLASTVQGWPHPNWPKSARRDAHESARATRDLCELLVADGILEVIPETKKEREVAALRDLRREWISIGDEIEVTGRVTLTHVANFLSAYVWARYSLAWRPFSVVVEAVTASKLDRVRDLDRCHIRRVSAMVDIFRRLRPFAFAAEGHCLLHALTLVRFLSKYQLHPEWVVGVTTQPWGAHSWVQWDNFLLDTNPEKVCGYTPIMMV